MKTKKTLYEWLTTRYLLVVRNEENFEIKRTIVFTWSRFLVALLIFFTISVFFSFLLLTTLLSRQFNPRHAYSEMDKRLADLGYKVDSLEKEVQMKEEFILSIQASMTGELPPVSESVTQKKDTFTRVDISDISKISEAEHNFRKQFESGVNNSFGKSNDRVDAIGQYNFIVPVNGVVSKKYNAKESHFGIDIVARKNEAIKAIADGTVIMSSWTQDSGYVIGIQHKNQLVSFYKHNSVLHYKVGDYVDAGDLIAIIGNSGELTDGPHLHFEMWLNGSPVNPEQYIVF